MSLIAFIYRETNVNNLCEKGCKITKNEGKVQKKRRIVIKIYKNGILLP